MLMQQNSVFIDPENCGSSVGYYLSIEEGKYRDKPTVHTVTGTVVLADCSHKIDWAFRDDDLEKIDSAIAMLQEFRRKYKEAFKKANSLNTEK